MWIITNHQPRDTLFFHELTSAERKDFDYLDTAEKQETTVFFRYKGNVYEMGQFMRTPQNVKHFVDWDGFFADTVFSGIVVRWVMLARNQVIVGRYFT